MMVDRISIEAVSKAYGDKQVLRDVSLTMAPHEVVALIGPSGSGKSTLLRCVNRLVEPESGTIRIDGTSIDDESFGRIGLYKRIGIVFQAYNLFPHLSVLDNVTLAPRLVHGQSRVVAEEKGRELLALFGLAAFADAYPEQISGGQQQRTAIVRALATEPDVLLLDEVTASLDPELVGEVLTLIRQLKDKGLTMMIVTHEMSFARDVADRVCFLDGGGIVEQGPPGEVFRNPQQPRTQRFLQRIIESGRMAG